MQLRQNTLRERQILYEKNMKVLAEKYPEIVEKIINIRKTNDYTIKLIGKRNIPNIFINKNKQYYYEQKDPIEDVKTQILSLGLEKTSIAIFLGFGLGYELLFYGSELSEKLQTQQVLVIEKNIELFNQSLEWIDLSMLLQDRRVKFIVGIDDVEIGVAIKEYLSEEEKLNCLDAVSTIYHSSSFLLDKEYYLQFINIFNQIGAELLAQRKGINIVFEKNMEALRQNYPSLSEKVMSLKESGNYKIIKTGTEDVYNLWIEDRKTFYYDFENPIRDAEQQIEQLKLRNTRLALFLGCGLGYELEIFKNNIAIEQNTVGVVIVEKDLEIFRLALEVTDLTEYINKSKIKFIVGLGIDKLFLLFQQIFQKHNDILWAIKTLKAIYNTSSIEIDKEYYLETIREMKKASTYMLNYYGNDPEDSLIGVKNMLLNLNEILHNPGVNLLYDKFKGKPAVIVSTGPSLNKNKHLLKGLENKALIIGPDASLKPLLEIGVKPHMITSLERIPLTAKLLDGFKEEDVKDVYFAGCPVVFNECYQVYKGPRIIVYRQFDHFKWIGIERGMLDIKHSSGNMAFKIAEALGCDPIILIGQDLAYSRDGKTHASGTHFGEIQGSQNRSDDFEVMGNDGEMITTKPIWNLFLKSYEIDIMEYNGVCVNSTEGGAYINGTQVMPFKEAIEKYIHEDIYPLEIIKRNAVLEVGSDERELERLMKIITNTFDYMEKIINSCDKGNTLLESYTDELNNYLANNDTLSNDDIKRINLMEEKIIVINKEVYEDKELFQLFFMHIIQSYLIKFEMEMMTIPDYYDNINLAKAKSLLERKRFFTTLKGIAEICKDMLSEAKLNLENKNTRKSSNEFINNIEVK